MSFSSNRSFLPVLLYPLNLLIYVFEYLHWLKINELIEQSYSFLYSFQSSYKHSCLCNLIISTIKAIALRS